MATATETDYAARLARAKLLSSPTTMALTVTGAPFMAASRMFCSSSILLSTNLKKSNVWSPMKKPANVVGMQCSSGDTSRPIVAYDPDIWADYLDSISVNESKLESYCMEVEKLKEKAGNMFLNLANDEEDNPMEIIKFIHSLIRLNLSYHFEELMERCLNRIFHSQLPELLSDPSNDYDLETTAVAFLTLRMQGYRLSPNVFNKFWDEKDGKFKESIATDARGMLGLYEASFLLVHGEDVLEEAQEFTKAHLQIMLEDKSSITCPPHLRSHIVDALKLPMCRSIQIWEARKYIDFYENDDPNQTLLKFAKVDFNRLQQVYQQELSQGSKWLKESHLTDNYPHVRKRIVEMYHWCVIHCEPRLAPSRIMLFKIYQLIIYIDDIYDSYSTHQERKIFTEAIQRWSYDAVDELPDYMRILYRAALDTFRDFENDVITQGRSFSVDYAKHGLKHVVNAYHLETEWLEGGSVHVPTLDEYLSGPGLDTSTVLSFVTVFFMGMGEIAGVEEFEWSLTMPKIVKATAAIMRIRDDITDHQFQRKVHKLHIASSVDCYMKQYGVSEEKAIRELKIMCENAWKDINEEMMSCEVPRKLLQLLPATAALTEVTFFNDEDTFNYPQLDKQTLSKLYAEEIPI